MCVICIHVLVSQFVKAQILFYFCFISIMEINVEADTCILVYFCSEKSENIKLNKTQIIENQALSAQSRTRAKGACFNEEPSINMLLEATKIRSTEIGSTEIGWDYFRINQDQVFRMKLFGFLAEVVM